MSRKLLVFCFLFSVACTAGASGSRGTVGFNFLRTAVAARPAAMGGAFVAVSGDLSGIAFNPAGVADVRNSTAQMAYLDHVLDFKSGFVTYGGQYGRLGSYQVSASFVDYGDFQETDVSGLATGKTFGAGTVVLGGAFAREVISRVLIGTNIKYVRSYIDAYNSQALAVDFGFLVHTPFNDWDAAASVQNVGYVFSAFVEDKDPLPLCFRFGGSKRLAHLPLLLSVETFKYQDDDFQFAVGGEFTVSPQFFLRWGYTSLARQMKVDTDADQFAGLSLGIGFLWRQYRIDYSFSSLGELGNLNRFGLIASF